MGTLESPIYIWAWDVHFCWLSAIVPLFCFIPTMTYTSLCWGCYKIFAAVLLCCIAYYFYRLVFLTSIVGRLVIGSASSYHGGSIQCTVYSFLVSCYEFHFRYISVSFLHFCQLCPPYLFHFVALVQQVFIYKMFEAVSCNKAYSSSGNHICGCPLYQ